MMGNQAYEHRQREAGFTLVELAVVMIIIGLLIGGILKGQELIANAAITGTASSTKGIDAATTTFRDTYAAMAGDMTNPTARLPNCAAGTVCGTVGNGDGRITGNILAAPVAEMDAFWAQLSAADLITGVDPLMTNANTSWGGEQPKAPIAGGFHAAFNATATLGANNAPRAGHYLILNTTPGAAPGGTALTGLQAARLDRKMDDGSPTTGTVFPLNVGGGSPCNAGAVYSEATANAQCDLFMRFQN